MNAALIKHPTIFAFVAAIMALAVLSISFLFMEPRVALSQTNSQEFEVTTTINGEISFEVEPTDVTLLPAIPGVTGGTASGSTPFTVLANNATGYTVSIFFEDSTAMQYDQGAGSIPNVGATAIPNFVSGSTTANTSSFGYTVTGGDVVAALLGTTASCGSGSALADACYLLQPTATSPFTIINRGSASIPGGDDYDIYFRVVVEENPSPALPTGTYTATATLTATENA